MIQASENALLVFDNASSMKWDMSDALCSLATGSGFSTRKLWTNDDSQTFKRCRPSSSTASANLPTVPISSSAPSN